MDSSSPPPAKSRRSDRNFLIAIYLGALLVRTAVGFTIIATGYIPYFSADHWTYDFFGWGLAQAWAGQLQSPRWVLDRAGAIGNNGMFYWVASIYTIFGHSEYTAVFIQVAVTSLTPVIVFQITKQIYGSSRAGRLAAILVAFLPSMVIWSCVLLKDPLIIFLISLTVYFTLKLQKELRFRYIVPASLAMILVFPIRGYVFYFVLTSVFGSLLMSRFGRRADLTGYLIRLGGIMAIILLLFLLGFDRIASQQLSINLLERIQISRVDLARLAKSGFDTAADVSTLGGALAFLPKGILYLLFAPFPWQGGGSRILLAMPEVICWYMAFPFCVAGFFYTVKRHFRDALVVFLFVVQLTVFYGIFIGNVGTAHRQRTQVFVFYLIFTCVGWVQFKRSRMGLKGSISDPT